MFGTAITAITAIISGAGKFIPFLGPLLERIAPGENAKVAEYRAQKELIEAKAFAKGRYSPKYIMHYAKAAFYAVICVVLVIYVFNPEIVSGVDYLLKSFRTLIELSHEAGQ
jgi:hypothetical protein